MVEGSKQKSMGSQRIYVEFGWTWNDSIYTQSVWRLCKSRQALSWALPTCKKQEFDHCCFGIQNSSKKTSKEQHMLNRPDSIGNWLCHPRAEKKNRRRKVDGKQFFAVIWTNVKFQSQWPTTFWNENVRVMVRVISVICRAQTIFWSESNFAFKFKVPFCWYYHGSKNVFFRVFHQKIMFPWYRAQPVTPPKIQNVRCLTTKGSFASLHFRGKNKKTDPTDEREQLIVDWFGLSISQTMNRYMPRFVPCNAHDGPTRRQWFFH